MLIAGVRAPMLLVFLAASILLAGCSAKSACAAATASGPPPACPVRVVIAASEVLVGTDRILLGITDAQNNPIVNAHVHLRLFAPQVGGKAPSAETDAIYLGGTQGAAKALYSMRATFDRPGQWRVEAVVTQQGKPPLTVPATLDVMAKGDAPAVGQPFPPAKNATSADVPAEQLTSQRPIADADFYKLSVAGALQGGKPLMVVVATPAFCETQTCGPQLEAAQALKKAYADRMNFIHIEVFQRPDLLLQGQGQPQVNPILFDWKLQTEPWVFIVDAHGNLFDRFEGYAPESELAASVQRLFQ